MPTPSTRTPVRIARGSYSNLNSSISDLGDGEICYAEDQDKLYIKEGSSLVVLSQPAADPTFTGTVTIPTPTAGDNSTKAASTAFVVTSFAPKASPLLTGSIEFNGQLKEAVVVTAGKLSDNTNLNIESGNVFLFTTAESTTSTPNLRYNGSTTLDSKMAVGDCLSVTIITTANASGYSAQLTIDGAAVTENWTGGSVPSAGGSSGKDIHAYTIIKTGTSGTLANDYTVIANFTKTS